ncbi:MULTISPECIES: dTDP-4-dehydrorhamnose 3,5-epimerase [unclassified Beijerinckia]|uniref:dTDP-4-dehydrorhamnose 3,5-epimerase n=1 Tax=unclassified Beijerinckia TaxID=2638183 RepID=UPI000894FD6A|nr:MULTISPECIES: dTDP-4-dehydrorhamnose 3,5-epimerase [unclassified Beijerinckia]MDH7797010.1 dTDP-4-dehydrorhamnose 3,5-epimerase [Beijerinckia sp. GAS462]SEC68539.1 dTDP-4-dehydrorhamnose 3,5-epimerase [Beijerinckia sp. 28-YEA-48]
MSKFRFQALGLKGPLLIKTFRFGDTRGYFMETYNAQLFAEGGVDAVFLQDNQSLSAQKGIIRGLHFQRPPTAQAKLVRVLRGAIYDVAIDIRIGSPSYGRWCSATLSAENGDQLFIPRGFAHGFCTLEANTEVAYKVDNPYSAEDDSGIFWADPALAIDWPVTQTEAIVSSKDAGLPLLNELINPFHVEETF